MFCIFGTRTTLCINKLKIKCDQLCSQDHPRYAKEKTDMFCDVQEGPAKQNGIKEAMRKHFQQCNFVG